MNKRLYTLCAFVLVGLLLQSGGLLAGELSVQAVVEKNRVYVGEPFILQIQVDGADDPEKPDIRPLTDFDVSFNGGQQNSSQSISIVNGKMSRVSHEGYVFNYQLSAKKEGRLVIPSLLVKVDNQTLQTDPVNILASQPQERNDLKLRLSLSKNEVYVGEPLQLKVVWYIGKDVNGFAFNLPVLNDPRFQVEIAPDQPTSGSSDSLVKVPLGDRQVLARKGSGRLGNKKFMTVTFSLILLPKKAGTITLPKSTVSCQVFNSYRQNRRDPFNRFFQDDVFNNIFNQSRGSYETAIVPSNQPEIRIKELPIAGRPTSFTGLVGQYSIATQASATEVNVGDPITLTILVTGPPFLGNVELSPLQQMSAFADGFKIPTEMAPGQVQEKSKVFTQTIRAKRAGVTEIPPVELSFFDPGTGRYATASSEPIPLKVKATRIVTAQDAEGGAPPAATGSELSIQEKGIAHNYEDSDALLPQPPVYEYWTVTRTWLAVLLLPPLLFLLCFMGAFLRSLRQKDPAALQAKKALSLFRKELEKLPAAPDDTSFLHLAEALRRYLGSRLNVPAAAITFADVAGVLAEKGVLEEACSDLRTLFDICEAARFGGVASHRPEDWQELIERAAKTIQQIDRIKI